MLKDKRLVFILSAGIFVLAIFFLVVSVFFEEDESEYYGLPEEKVEVDFYNDDLNKIKDISIPLEKVLASNFEELVLNINSAGFVLLGEASHGTSEYYQIRAEITKRLIADEGFSFIAVEGDWPNLYKVNLYVKGGIEDSSMGAEDVLLRAARWPEWMWANEDFLDLVIWLRDYNAPLSDDEKVGIYGIDMQDLSASLDASLSRLEKADDLLAVQVAEKYRCILSFKDDLFKYVEAYAQGKANCELKTRMALVLLKDKFGWEEIIASPVLLDIKQNMLAVQYAETYGRAIVAGGPHSWNVRSNYMKKTIQNLREHYGDGSRGIVWAHNTHVGDARATSMKETGEFNIGQLLREAEGEDNIFILGFGSNRGELKTGREWNFPGEVVNLPPALNGSIEYKLAQLNMPGFLLLFNREEEKLPELLKKPFYHRAKGVIYNPAEDANYYVPTILARRYDAFIFIEKTSALKQLNSS